MKASASSPRSVRAHVHEARLADINRIFSDMKAGRIDGRMVMTLP
jgi:alcohol dehydrogenase, propanol-preferring